MFTFWTSSSVLVKYDWLTEYLTLILFAVLLDEYVL